jgi:DNA polymerase delta subunit 4
LLNATASLPPSLHAASCVLRALLQPKNQHEHPTSLTLPNSKFGPCIGMTRLERWERAEKLGLAPPPAVRELLLAASAGSGGAAAADRLNQPIWAGRV